MPRERFGPDDPREWLARARSALLYAANAPAGIDPEDIAFQAQQAAEKAIKAVWISRDVGFPYTHNLNKLFGLVHDAGVVVPPELNEARGLSVYGVAARYPIPRRKHPIGRR